MGGRIITISWKGEDYTLNEDEAFLAASEVEEVITVGELVTMLQSLASIKFARLARAYGALLREAGANVTDREIHDEFKKALSGGKAAEKLALARTALLTLTGILMDGAPAAGEDKEPKNESSPSS